ncbi:two component regulator [Nitzschia inconspicua]|uniref:Two component regulator n=1 Tax=Nitzschia inconspicua TaxID=303405 RepID=A0A9K3KUJ9_9STRA|nr:two component regulator [Nitzschia inconspicua]
MNIGKEYPPKQTFDIDDTSIIDEDDVAVIMPVLENSVYPIVDEDLEDQHIHDQLPSVEEAKAKLPHKSIDHGKKRRLCYIAMGITTVILFIIIVAVASGNKKTSTKSVGSFQEVSDFLVSNGISTSPAMTAQKSPERLAATFVADGRWYHAGMSKPRILRFLERYVLALIYYETNGPQWTKHYKFLSALDHCEWGETMSHPAGNFVKGVECDRNGRVIGLDLSNNNLTGYHITEQIQIFGQMQRLHLYKNRLGGGLPHSIKSMAKLKSIGLMDTGIGGTIPDWIGDLTQLTTLALSGNEVHGSVPFSLSKLTNLRILGLDGLGLTGSINPFKGLKKLEALYLEDNALTGNLHGDLWPAIRELDVSNNLLGGTIPSLLFQHRYLTILNVNHNLFGGSFPDDILLNKLEYVNMQNNDLVGTVSDRIGYMTNLKHFDISLNGFTGSMPDTISALTGLQSLNTSGNKFTSGRMMDLSMLSNLHSLSMKGNNFIGDIPESLVRLSNLRTMDLDGNHLSGRIPTRFGTMVRLEHLLLNRNDLTGTIPRELSKLTGLKVLLLDGNNLRGNANAICDASTNVLVHFIADCASGGSDGNSKPEVDCTCCTMCCSDDDPDCNNKAWMPEYDLKYVYGFIRQEEYGSSLEETPQNWGEISK